MLFCFVILHFKTAEDTKLCIESIERLDTPHEVRIIVVDNASGNGSVEALMRTFAGHDNVEFILNRENLGFARGNNAGYARARALKADFIAVMNNDTAVDSPDFVEGVQALYDETGFALMGPDIVSMVDGGHQNPPAIFPADPKKVRRLMLKYWSLRLLNRLNVYDLLYDMKKRHPSQKARPFVRERRENVQLHGACIVYSPAFIAHEPYAFCPETFLYTEEAILYRYCLRKGYKTLYDPRLRILHKEDSSTNALVRTSRAKREFLYTNLIASHKVYLRQLKEAPLKW